MKEQGSAALRIVAFAVALAVVLGLASVMFSVTVSAESVESAADDTVASLGTIGNYRSIKFTAGQKLDVEFLYSAYSSSTSTNLYGRVFGYKNGKFVTFNNNNFSIRSDSSGQYHNIYFVVRNLLMNGFLILLIVHIFNLVFTIIIIAIPVFVLRTVNHQWAVHQL